MWAENFTLRFVPEKAHHKSGKQNIFLI